MSSLSFSCINSEGTGFVMGVSENCFPTVTLDSKAGIYIMGAWNYWICMYVCVCIYIYIYIYIYIQRRMISD